MKVFVSLQYYCLMFLASSVAKYGSGIGGLSRLYSTNIVHTQLGLDQGAADGAVFIDRIFIWNRIAVSTIHSRFSYGSWIKANKNLVLDNKTIKHINKQVGIIGKG